MTTDTEKRPASKAKALADAEAERTEVELAEGEEGEQAPPEGEPEPETTPEPEYPPEPTEEMFAAVRTLNGYHHEAIREVMGPFIADFEECDNCGGSGLAYPTPTGPQLEMAPNESECPVCKGYGELKRPSKRQGFDIEQCANCNGQGWVGPGNLNPQSAAAAAVAAYPGNGAEPPQPVTPPPPGPPTTDPRVAALRAEGFTVIDPIVR